MVERRGTKVASLARKPEELVDAAWGMVDEAIKQCTMTTDDGVTHTLEVNELVALVKWLAMAKVKRPQFVPTPEDFNLKETTGAKSEKQGS